MSSNGNFLTSPKGKKIMNYAYGIGASVVIIGALFKILHWPFAAEMLIVGMGTEAILFALGAFEPPHEEATRWDWSTIYPDIQPEKSIFHDDNTEDVAKINKKVDIKIDNPIAAPATITTNINSTPTSSMSKLSSDDADKWNENIKNVSETVASLGKIANAAKVSEDYISKLNDAGIAIDHFSKAQEASAEVLVNSTEKFNSTMNTVAVKFDSALESSTGIVKETISNTASKIGSTLTKVYEDSIGQMSNANNLLSESYKEVSNTLTQNLSTIKSSTGLVEKSLQDVSKNLTAINAVYELQLASANNELKIKEAQITTQVDVNSKLSDIHESIAKAASANKDYQQESETLKNNIANLNNIYGNMLSSFNS